MDGDAVPGRCYGNAAPDDTTSALRAAASALHGVPPVSATATPPRPPPATGIWRRRE